MTGQLEDGGRGQSAKPTAIKSEWQTYEGGVLRFQMLTVDDGRSLTAAGGSVRAFVVTDWRRVLDLLSKFRVSLSAFGQPRRERSLLVVAISELSLTIVLSQFAAEN